MDYNNSGMKVFLDTNIFMEFFEQRTRCGVVRSILHAIEDKTFTGVISSGGLYTLTYLLTLGLKRNNIHRPEQTERLRNMLRLIVSLCTVVDSIHDKYVAAINDESFNDIEDSYQYQCALQNGCTQFVTINIKDYKDAGQTSIEILTPETFADKYLQTNSY